MFYSGNLLGTIITWTSALCVVELNFLLPCLLLWAQLRLRDHAARAAAAAAAAGTQLIIIPVEGAATVVPVAPQPRRAPRRHNSGSGAGGDGKTSPAESLGDDAAAAFDAVAAAPPSPMSTLSSLPAAGGVGVGETTLHPATGGTGVSEAAALTKAVTKALPLGAGDGTGGRLGAAGSDADDGHVAAGAAGGGAIRRTGSARLRNASAGRFHGSGGVSTRAAAVAIETAYVGAHVTAGSGGDAASDDGVDAADAEAEDEPPDNAAHAPLPSSRPPREDGPQPAVSSPAPGGLPPPTVGSHPHAGRPSASRRNVVPGDPTTVGPAEGGDDDDAGDAPGRRRCPNAFAWVFDVRAVQVLTAVAAVVSGVALALQLYDSVLPPQG